MEAVRKTLKIEEGQTTRDKLFSLEVVACMGACGLSPVICINGEVHARVSPVRATQIIDMLRQKELIHEHA